ncbi:MAG: universal stress protein [Pseudomonadota bacterium]
MTKLIALVDGSIYSRSVCDHAAWAAGRLGAEVEIMHVIGRRQTGSAPADLSGSIGLGARSALLEELAELDARTSRLAQARGRAILEDGEAILREAGLERVSTRLRIGDLLEEVAEREAGADMLLIGKRGEAADFASGHLGSNLERIVRAADLPVLLVAREFRPVERVLIAYDGGASSLRAVDHVARSPLFRGLPVKLLMASENTPEARRKLDGAAAILEGGGLEVEREARPGQAETVIAEAVETEGIGLLVMGAYGHSRIRSLVVGSTTTEMVRRCRIPVLLFR